MQPTSNNQQSIYFGQFRRDSSSALALFLVAIPLCLGIALASGAPLYSGLIAGIVGAILVASLGGSALGISGPAAGLTVVVFSAIAELGFETFLLTVVIAGFLQVVMGICRAGVISYYFPSAVIKGMLSGIGFIIFLKQIPHALGYDADYEGDMSFIQGDNYTTFSEMNHMLGFIEPGAVFISVTCLIILIIWETPFLKRYRFAKLFHGAIIAVPAGTAINLLFTQFAPELALSGKHLVSLPMIKNTTDLLSHYTPPDFSQLGNPKVLLTAVTLALVASLETLLTVEGTDKLDPQKRVTPVNRELCAQGVGNIVCGFLGGLPVTQLILRSSINIQAGAQTKASAIMHGLMILAAVLIIPTLINLIPLASLAAVLLVVGYKLAAPTQLAQIYNTGHYHFIPFIVTVLGLILTDLLTGISIGMAIALFFILRENHKSAFIMDTERERNKTILHLSETVSFLNKANLAKFLNTIPRNSHVILDATKCGFMDYDVYELIQNFKTEAQRKNIDFELENFRGYGILDPVKSSLPLTQDYQQSLTPTEVLEILKAGNRRFVNNLKSNRNSLEMINVSSEGQFPLAIILSCIDSRTSAELIFDHGLGDVFSVRVAGNIINDDILGCMEFACKASGSKLIVVLGHSNCGAIKGACAGVKMGNLTVLLDKIRPAIDAVKSESEETIDDLNAPEVVQQVAEHNVELSRSQIRKGSTILQTMESNGEIGIVSAMYHIDTGIVEFMDEALV